MNKNSPSFFISAGELSGDLHASHLVQALRKQLPDASFAGIAGERMRAVGVEGPFPLEQLQVMGFTDVLGKLPAIWKMLHHTVNYILENEFTVVILIDYPGFNLRIARQLRKRGYRGKIVQCIAPTVWAHGKTRIKTLAENIDLLLTIYPFESKYFENTSLKVSYIGNPLQEYIRNHLYDEQWKLKVGISSNEPIIAFFPGSRPGEIKTHLPLFLQALQEFRKENPSTLCAISYANDDIEKLIRSHTDLEKVVLVPKKYSYELMRDSHTAIAKSGTVTLELALHRRPSLVIYSLSTLNYLFAKFILRLKLPHYCIVNILNKKEVFPELIGKNISSKEISDQLNYLYKDGEKRDSCISDCISLNEQFSNSLASHRAAEKIAALL